MGGTNCYIAYVLGDGSTKGCFQFNNGFPTGFGQLFVDFLKRKTPEEIEKFTNLLETINWVEEDDAPEPEWKDHYVLLDYHDDDLFYWRKLLTRFWEDVILIRRNGETDSERRDRMQCYVLGWKDLLTAFSYRHSETWEPIMSGDLNHLVLYHYFEVDDYRDYCYYIDFHKRTVEIEFFKGGYALASFDALMEDSDLLRRIEYGFERNRWAHSGELEALLQNLAISRT